jgi:hypothetical protein
MRLKLVIESTVKSILEQRSFELLKEDNGGGEGVKVMSQEKLNCFVLVSYLQSILNENKDKINVDWDRDMYQGEDEIEYNESMRLLSYEIMQFRKIIKPVRKDKTQKLDWKNIYNECVDKLKEIVSTKKHSFYLNIIFNNFKKFELLLNRFKKFYLKFEAIEKMVNRVINYRISKEKFDFVYGQDQIEMNNKNTIQSNQNISTNVLQKVEKQKIEDLDLSKFKSKEEIKSNLRQLMNNEKYGDEENRLYLFGPGFQKIDRNSAEFKKEIEKVKDKNNLKAFAKVYNRLMRGEYKNDEYLQTVMAACIISFDKFLKISNSI